MAYTQVYSTTDVQEAVVDVIAGIFDGLAGMASTYGTALIALMVIGAVFLIIGRVKSLGGR